VIRSLVTSLVGAAPPGGVTFGSVASGPLVGVLAVVDVSPALPACASALSALFSFPIVIVLLEPLEPQPAISTAAASIARPRPARERVVERTFMLVTVAQPTGTAMGGCALGSLRTVLGGEVAVP